MRIQGHLIDFLAALSDSGTTDARTTLSELQSDGVAQVMSFVPQNTINQYFCTLASACPRMRLDIEMLMGYFAEGRGIPRAHVEENRLFYKIRVLGETQVNLSIVHSLWWADQCSLPILFDVDNACGDSLAILTKSLKRRVSELQVHITSEPECAHNAQQPCGGNCGTILCSLSSLPNMSKLTIMCGMYVSRARVAAGVTCALHVSAQMPVSELQIYGCEQLGDFSALLGSQHLRRLTANYCGIHTVTDLRSCSRLAEVDISYNDSLENLRGLAGAPNLEKLAVRSCNLNNVDGLGSCPLLIEVDVSHNRSLQDLGGLAGAQCLERAAANQCDLRSVDGLSACPNLKELELRYNWLLRDITELARSARLTLLDVSGCNVTSTSFLSPSVKVKRK